jgi:hypothetical protein
MTTSPPSGGRRRERRRWPKVLLVTIAFVLIVSVAFGGFVWWRFGVPAVGDEITPFNDYARSLQPEGKDGWPALERLAREGLGYDIFAEQPWRDPVWAPSRSLSLNAETVRTCDPDDARMPEAIEAVEEFAHLLPELDAIAAADVFVFLFRKRDDAPGTLAEAMQPLIHAGTIVRQLNSLNAAHMRLASEREDWAEVRRRLTTGVRLGQHIGRTPLLLPRIMGYAAESLAWSQLEQLLIERTPPTEVIDNLLALCDEVDPPLPLREAMLGEEIGSRGFLKQYLDFERGEFDPFDTDSWSNWLNTPSYRAIARAWREFNEATLPIIDLPPAEREAKRMPTPPLVMRTAFVGDPYEMMVGGRDGLLRQRAAVQILLHLNLAIAESGVIPADPLAALPADLRVDPISGGTILVDAEPTGRFIYTLRWPVQDDWGFDRVFTERTPFDQEPE